MISAGNGAARVCLPLLAALWLMGGAARAPICAQTPVKLAPAKVQAIERLVALEMERQKIPGLSVAIANDLEAAWESGFGFADVENEVRVTPATVFRLGSISKPITAVAVLQLAEKGIIDLDAPVQKYIPQFPEKRWPITARALLGHLGGIRHYQDQAEFGSTRHYSDVFEPLKIFDDEPLLFEPGTRFFYSTYGYNLLGAIVEAASGMTFTEYLSEKVLRPAGAEHIRADDVYQIIPHRSRGYRKTALGAIENCALADTSNKIPGGGLVSTAGDLIRFAIALQRGKLLKRETLNQMFTSQKTRDGRPTNYGLGWYILERGGRKWIEHSGSQQGTSTDLLILPENGLAVAVLANLERADARSLSSRIAGLVLQ